MAEFSEEQLKLIKGIMASAVKEASEKDPPLEVMLQSLLPHLCMHSVMCQELQGGGGLL